MLYPTGYGTQLLSLHDLIHRHCSGCEPETVLRVTALLIDRDGFLGIGGGQRPCPSDTSPASQACKSFHQTQTFADQTRWFCAFDFVYLADITKPNGTPPTKPHVVPPTGIIPVQGTPQAAEFLIHANVGTPGTKGFESWHGQPSEFDGFDTWVRSGRPRPTPILLNALPPDHVPTPPPYDLRITAMLTALHTIDPIRFFDTRGLGGPVPAGEYTVTPPSVPDLSNVTGVQVNIKVVNPQAAGFLIAYTNKGATPSTSVLDFTDDDTPAFNTMLNLPVDATGSIQVYVNVPCGIVVDLYGAWT